MIKTLIQSRVCCKMSWLALVLPLLLVYPTEARSQTRENPSHSPDGLWQVLDDVEFPERFSPPVSFETLGLDVTQLETLLADAPRETFIEIPTQAQIFLPLVDGGFSLVSVAQSQLMEAALANQFPQIKTYVFVGDGIAGHIAVGPQGLYLTAQVGTELWQIKPVETRQGRVYVSFFDQDRTDGGSVIIHDPDMLENDEPVPASGPVVQALQVPPPLAVVAGNQLRIYRLAASTTGEFYQARDTGNGLLDVLFSLIIDIVGANAVLEPEVSVRLILSLASLDVIYDDPDNDPFDNSYTGCTLRDENRDNMKLVLEDDDYDLGFLFAARSGRGANGCAWYVVCLTTNDKLHKARGAGKMGNNGLNSASGLLAHEVGHQLGARHTFTGQAGRCTTNEFLAGNSESGYEPGSGTTRMSYNGICDSDNVDVSKVPAGSYFHSRSFDEIVDNVFFGDGATCGTLVATGNLPPTVDAGPDYTIPRQTPFTLSGSAVDSEPLTYNWEQFDRAITPRPIDTDFILFFGSLDFGPIIRSVPPGVNSSRTIPHLQDLLDGVTRAGEILPQVDRELNFRLVARDNLMGGGGVAYDSMEITVQGNPFFVTSPNGGEALLAGCPVPVTWTVGGGDMASDVNILFSGDGGNSFAIPSTAELLASTANDGNQMVTMSCTTTNQGRLKVEAADNIFFDVSDNNFTVNLSPPTVSVSAAANDGVSGESCGFLVTFEATVTDDCGVDDSDVDVDFSPSNVTLGIPDINTVQVNPLTVTVEGSVLISQLTGSPATLGIEITAADLCGAESSDLAEVQVEAILGTPGDDVIIGTPEADVIDGGDGNDRILGRDGNDIICGGQGDDSILGGNGNDNINGGSGNDRVIGGNGADSIAGGDGDDDIVGGDGDDTLAGGPGDDRIVSGNGADNVTGDDGNDKIVGGSGDDTLNGGPGNDQIIGGSGTDSIVGGLGTDTCLGEVIVQCP